MGRRGQLKGKTTDSRRQESSTSPGGQSGWGACLSWGWGAEWVGAVPQLGLGVRGESASLHTPCRLQRPSLQAVAKHMRVSVCMCVHV